MIKHRVYFKDNNDVEIETVSPKYQSSLGTDKECKIPPHLNQFDYSIMSYEQVPKIGEIEDWAQLYHENNNLKKDLSWEVRLMPDHLLKRKHLKSLSDKIETELMKDTPDPIVIARLQLDCEKCKKEKAGPHNENLFWAEKALAGLERAEIDKPVIRQKLEEKISKLRGES